MTDNELQFLRVEPTETFTCTNENTFLEDDELADWLIRKDWTHYFKLNSAVLKAVTREKLLERAGFFIEEFTQALMLKVDELVGEEDDD